MLVLVWICNKTRWIFDDRIAGTSRFKFGCIPIPAPSRTVSGAGAEPALNVNKRLDGTASHGTPSMTATAAPRAGNAQHDEDANFPANDREAGGELVQI